MFNRTNCRNNPLRPITLRRCEAVDCCYDNSIIGVPWCFHQSGRVSTRTLLWRQHPWRHYQNSLFHHFDFIPSLGGTPTPALKPCMCICEKQKCFNDGTDTTKKISYRFYLNAPKQVTFLFKFWSNCKSSTVCDVGWLALTFRKSLLLHKLSD